MHLPQTRPRDGSGQSRPSQTISALFRLVARLVSDASATILQQLDDPHGRGAPREVEQVAVQPEHLELGEPFQRRQVGAPVEQNRFLAETCG